MIDGFLSGAALQDRFEKHGYAEIVHAPDRPPAEVAGRSHQIDTVLGSAARECQFTYWAPSRILHSRAEYVADWLAIQLGWLAMPKEMTLLRWRLMRHVASEFYNRPDMSVGWVEAQTMRVPIYNRLRSLQFNIEAHKEPGRAKITLNRVANSGGDGARMRCLTVLGVHIPLRWLQFESVGLQDTRGARSPRVTMRREFNRRFDDEGVRRAFFTKVEPSERQVWFASIDKVGDAPCPHQLSTFGNGKVPAGLRHCHMPTGINYAQIITFVRLDGEIQHRLAFEFSPVDCRVLSVRAVTDAPLVLSLGMDQEEARQCDLAYHSYCR